MRIAAAIATACLVAAASSGRVEAQSVPPQPSRDADDARRPLIEKSIRWEVGDKIPVEIEPFSFVRLIYESVESDDRYDFIGRNDGFILDSARVGLDANIANQLRLFLSIEAASDTTEDTNNPLGEIEVELRDAFGRWDPFFFVGIQAGQFRAPFSAEELRLRQDLLFVERAVGIEGVLPGRGFEQPGLAVDRQIGVMLSPQRSITLGDFGIDEESPLNPFGFRYYVMAANGNGESQLINDNSELAVFTRFELLYDDYVQLGGAYFYNERTVGDPPNRFDEDDTGWAADALLTPWEAEIFFQYARVETDFPTVGTEDRVQEAWHIQFGYLFRTPWFFIKPGYRYATFDPWASGNDGSGLDLSVFDLQYHTFGFKIGHLTLPITFFFNYTITDEKAPRELDNNRLQLLMQVEI
jgi:hypothetical protein